MADYVGYARSNYFKVKDEEAFKVWVNNLPIECHEGQDNTFMVMEADNIGWLCRFDFTEELSEHLADGWVAIIVEVGYEKMRYLHGYTEAFNNKGESIFKTLSFGTDELKKLGEHHTDPSY